jgi:2,4-dienoyl-CoA reductase (NADPH2)
VEIPLVATNRINMPELAEELLADGGCDLVSMARPLLADPDWVAKAARDGAEEINTCIACNQACLDHVFVRKHATCLVNPRAARETELLIEPAASPRRIAVVGAGPAGMACAATAAERGHTVELFEAAGQIGGQFNLARRVPGKEEFAETLRYFGGELERRGATVHLGVEAGVDELRGFDVVVLATGVRPRVPAIDGIEHASVLRYVEVLEGADVGRRVAVVGAGGIGVDVSEFLTHGESPTLNPAAWAREWGVGDPEEVRGGVAVAEVEPSPRQVTLLQRKDERIGKHLGKTSGWVHRAALANKKVEQVAGVSYDRIDDDGLHITVEGQTRVLAVDHVVICAGQESRRELEEPLRNAGVEVHVIGGAKLAAELDAKRAIDEGTRLAAAL